MQDNLAYRYFAFISYSSKDKKVAERTQRKIETYRLPTVLRNELEAANKKKYPQRVKPLFRDMLDMDGSPRPDKLGVVRRTYKYDECGNLVETMYFDLDGNQVKPQ